MSDANAIFTYSSEDNKHLLESSSNQTKNPPHSLAFF